MFKNNQISKIPTLTLFVDERKFSNLNFILFQWETDVNDQNLTVDSVSLLISQLLTHNIYLATHFGCNKSDLLLTNTSYNLPHCKYYEFNLGSEIEDNYIYKTDI